MAKGRKINTQNQQSAVVDNTSLELLKAEKRAADQSYQDSKNLNTLTHKICHSCLYEFRLGERETRPPQFAVDTDPSVKCPVCGGELSDSLRL